MLKGVFTVGLRLLTTQWLSFIIIHLSKIITHLSEKDTIHPPITLSLVGSSNGTSKHLYLITKAAARDHNKSKKHRGNSPTSDLFSVMRLAMRNQSLQKWHTWTPYFDPLAPSCLIAFDYIHPYRCRVSYGNWIISKRENKWILWRPQQAHFREKLEAQSLSPISLSVSVLEVPRRFGHTWETASSFSSEEASSWPITEVTV